MQDKKFLTILGAATFVLVVGLLVYGIMQNSEIDKQMKKRVKAVKQTQKIDVAKTPNDNIIDQEKNKVQQIKDAKASVIREFLKPVIGKYEIPALKNDSIGKAVKSFPFSESVWSRNGWAQKYKQYYDNMQKELCDSLGVVTLPDSQKIIDLALELDAGWDLDRRFKIQQLGKDKIPPLAADMKKTIKVGEKLAEDGIKKEAIMVSLKAIKIAMNKYIVESVKTGNVYINKAGLPNPPVFAGKQFVPSITGEDAWNVLVSTWVQRDIFKAIKKTNDYAFAKANITNDADKNILRSAIKRVERIEVTNMMNASVLEAARTAISQAEKKARRNAQVNGQDPRFALNKLFEVENLPKINTLTGKYPNRQYDVVNYSFTVLMPSRYVSILERNLIESGYHIILEQEIAVDIKTSAPKSKDYKLSGNEEFDSALLTYYGTEPMSRVTIKGQLSLPTDFTRGRAQIVNNRPKWSKKFPNIMPGTILKKLFDTNSKLLRKEDLMSIGEYKMPKPANQQ